MGPFQTFCKGYPTMKEQVIPVEVPDSISRGGEENYVRRTEFLDGIFGCGASGSQASDRHTKERATDVARANIVAKLNAAGGVAVLAADAQTQVGVGFAAVMGSYLEQKVGIKNPPATEISSRGIGVLQVDLQVDITPSTWFYHAVMRFLECLRIL